MAARTAGLIGRESVPTPYGALIELVKNAHDADATKCIVYIDNNNDTIFIGDNGIGMSAETILEKWMIIGTNDKLINPKSAKDRIKAGAKGIGRFSLDRLGESCEMLTKTKNEKLLSWIVDWSAFDEPNRVLTDIKADLSTVDDIQQRYNLFVNNEYIYNRFFVDTFKNHGTVLKISKLRDNWNDKIDEARRQLETLKYPYSANDFALYYISSKNSINNENFEDFKIETPDYDDYDYRIASKYHDGKLSIDVYRNEIEEKQKTATFFKAVSNNIYPYDIEGYSQDKYTLEYNLETLLIDSPEELRDYIKQNLGNTDINLLFIKRGKGVGSEIFKYRHFDAASRRNWLDQYGGIKIYRDNFKIRPYGEGDMRDWLGLAARRAQNPAQVTRKGGGRLREDQVAGSIHISRLDSGKLDDVASREGLKDDALLEGLKQITLALIALIESDRHYAAVALDAAARQSTTHGLAVVEQARAIFNSSKKNKLSQDDFKKVKQAFNQQNRRIEEMAGELSLLRGLAGIGAATTNFAHDLRGLQVKIENYSNMTRRAIDTDYTFAKIEDKKSTPLSYLDRIKNQHRKIAHWLLYITGTIKRDKRTRKNIIPSEYLSTFQGNWSDMLADKRIALSINDQSNKTPIKAFEIDLDSLFSNLILNSIESLKKTTKGRRIDISIDELQDSICFTYTDTGIGLPHDLKDPNKIFEFGFSTKKDDNGEQGLGLGMYIVDCIVKDNKGDLHLVKKDTGFRLDITWPKTKR